jgi:hypothetical protein
MDSNSQDWIGLAVFWVLVLILIALLLAAA